MTPAEIQAAAFEGHPLLQMVRKQEDFTGAEMLLPLVVPIPQGRTCCVGGHRQKPHARDTNPWSAKHQSPAFRLFRGEVQGDEPSPESAAAFGKTLANALWGVRDGHPGWRPVAGVGDWIPAILNHDDEFFGIQRPVDRVRLAGHVLSGESGLADVIVDAIHEIGLGAPPPSHVFLPGRLVEGLRKVFKDWPNLVFDKTTSASLKFVVDPDMQQDRVFVLSMDTWCLFSLGPVASAAAHYANGPTSRLRAYCQLGCSSPGANAVVLL